jgi:hypothetical protein
MVVAAQILNSTDSLCWPMRAPVHAHPVKQFGHLRAAFLFPGPWSRMEPEWLYFDLEHSSTHSVDF